MDEKHRRALGIAIQILEEMPIDLRPDSNIQDMREILEGSSTGRDDIILTQAIATALAFRAECAMRVRVDPSRPEAFAAGLNNRWHEFENLFEAAARCSPSMLGLYFDEACRKTTSQRVEKG